MKTKEEIIELIEGITHDERFSYPTATVHENAPLALIQLGMESKVQVLLWVLGMALCERCLCVVEKTIEHEDKQTCLACMKTAGLEADDV